MSITRVSEQHAFLLFGGRAILDHGEMRVSNGIIVVVHWDPMVTAPDIRIGGVDTENRAIFPWDVVSFGSLIGQGLKPKGYGAEKAHFMITESAKRRGSRHPPCQRTQGR